MSAPIDIVVAREAETWKIRYGSVELDCVTQADALAEAIALAHAFGKAGDFSTVRTGVMTNVYGPQGFIRAIPTAKWSPTILSKPKGLNHAMASATFGGQVATPEALDERSRTSRIAAAFELSRKGPT
jgi:hypothetical protein